MNIKLSFQYVSDLHLDMLLRRHASVSSELFDYRTILEPVAPFLILVGDVAELRNSCYVSFLQYCSSNWKYVLLVPGNHEFYGMSIVNGLAYLDELSKLFPNLHVLSKKHIQLVSYPPKQDTKEEAVEITFVSGSANHTEQPSESCRVLLHIVGCTLWSHIPAPAEYDCKRMLNDFRRIDSLNIDTYNALHGEERKWLKETIQDIKQTTEPILVLTHHAPLMSQTSHPMYEIPDRQFNHAFCTNLDDIFIELESYLGSNWIFGHTHHRNRFVNRKTSVMTNAYGYPKESFTSSYQTSCILEIDVPPQINLSVEHV